MGDILPRPPKGPPPPMKCTWKGPIDGFLSGCAGDSCRNHNSIDEAKEACSKDELCTGIIKVAKNREVYQMRSGGKVSDSPSGEQSWTKTCVVDQAKLDEIHKNEMNKLDGKAVTDKKTEDKKSDKLMDRMRKNKDKTEENKKESESDKTIETEKDIGDSEVKSEHIKSGVWILNKPKLRPMIHGVNLFPKWSKSICYLIMFMMIIKMHGLDMSDHLVMEMMVKLLANLVW